MQRRTALSILAGAPLALAAPTDGFRFVHFTDTHIQPEMKAADGCRMCFGAINVQRPDFALCGGDLVFDSNETPARRAVELFDLYGETVKRLEMRVHSVPGNHDVVGLSTKSGIAATDPLYGKKTFEDRIGPRYSSFDHKGWHFILLDSIGTPAGGGFIGLIDEAQMAWLRADLEKTGTARPIVMMTHIPILSSVLQIVPDQWKVPSTYLVTNSTQLLTLLASYNVKAVLQGHTHIRETVVYNGCQYITSGAVCGNWWKGARLGHPEGFGVLTVRGEQISWEYRTYGFKAEV
ncbi:MAG TPA: metallophosphoesterase [Bryobacteraceae bacterium]|nr:metallophosphoesterase [Bryobacteraceae bacterium]